MQTTSTMKVVLITSNNQSVQRRTIVQVVLITSSNQVTQNRNTDQKDAKNKSTDQGVKRTKNQQHQSSLETHIDGANINKGLLF